MSVEQSEAKPLRRPYHPEDIEARWQVRWRQEKRGTPRGSGPAYYLLEMFPYPSGRIHMGHVRNYTIGDVLARFLAARGHRVLHPMGWDAFGLPAEQAAIKHGVQPAKWTFENIATMREQIQRMGFSYDWDREIATCRPEYYRWEQRFFLQMLERGLAYRKAAKVNWCEQCGTVLANEQVEGESCWRGHTPVVLRELDQWFLRITAYADELLACIDELAGWPEKVRTMQRNWIGRSEGVEIDFEVRETRSRLTVFTTRADTLYGATFVSLAVEHPLASELARRGGREAEVAEFIHRISGQDATERAEGKEGVFTGCYALSPLDGRALPIYLANFVLMEYGTGAIMAVPAHDQRDFEFARRYDLPILAVIVPSDTTNHPGTDQAFVEDGVLVSSGSFTGSSSRQAREAIAATLESAGHGRRRVHYRLRDWGISRQRYWGTPIPIVYCESCGVVPVPVERLPIELPTDVQLLAGGGSPLPTLESFVRTPCPRCGGAARRETDTMDTFMESSWYFLRFLSPRSDDVPFDAAAVREWMPVAHYIGGVEHAVLHLLYARFFTKVLRDLGWIDLSEPFARLLTQGMVIKDGAKMSKSKGNVVDPDALVSRYGADTARLFSMFAAPPEKDLEWSDQGVEGSYRFLTRVWRLVDSLRLPLAIEDPGASSRGSAERALRARVHETIFRVTRDIGERLHFNTAIAAVMELVNSIYEYRALPEDEDPQLVGFATAIVLQLLFPFVPHMTSELWEIAVGVPALADTAWPQHDPAALLQDSFELVVQVNGKIRGRIIVSVGTQDEEVVRMALSEESVARDLEGRVPRKTIVVPGRLVNVVV